MIDIASWDIQLFTFIQGFTGNPAVDSFFLVMAEVLVLSVPAVLTYLWFQSREDRDVALFTFLATVSGISLTYVLGLFYFHHQPFSVYSTIASSGELNNAFPSQHTATMFSVFWSFLYFKRRKLAGFFGAAGILTGFARVFVGFHYPLDILGGVLSGLLGVAVAVLIYRLAEDRVQDMIDFSYRAEKMLTDFLSQNV